MDNPSVALDRKLKSTTDHVTAIVMRDIRFAGQLIRAVEKNNNPTTIITSRGTLHLGLIHALNHFSPGSIPSEEIEKPRILQIGSNSATFIPMLWSKTFWQAAIQDNGITVDVARTNALMRHKGNIKKLIQSEQWNNYLTARIQESSNKPTQMVSLPLAA